MRNRWFLGGVIFLLLSWLLVGCGVAQEEYNAMVAQVSTAQEELQSVKVDYDKLSAECEDLQAEITSLMAEKESLEADYDKLSAECEDLQAEITSLMAEKESLEADYGKLKNEYATVTREFAQIKQSCDSVYQELRDLQAVYPPIRFSSHQELKSWIQSNAISDTPIHRNLITSYKAYVRALEIQEAALKDGFIISVVVGPHPEAEVVLGSSYVYLMAGVDDGIYWWFPDRDDIQRRVKIVNEELQR